MTEKTENIWDGMNRLFSKVRYFAEQMDWPELQTMVNEQVFKGIDEATEEDKLFNQEAYLMRICLRYERLKKAPFNIVSITKDDKFRITNYDYKTYLWAKKTYADEIDNNCIYIPYNMLSKKQFEAFKKKAVNNYEKKGETNGTN